MYERHDIYITESLIPTYIQYICVTEHLFWHINVIVIVDLTNKTMSKYHSCSTNIFNEGMTMQVMKNSIHKNSESNLLCKKAIV